MRSIYAGVIGLSAAHIFVVVLPDVTLDLGKSIQGPSLGAEGDTGTTSPFVSTASNSNTILPSFHQVHLCELPWKKSSIR